MAIFSIEPKTSKITGNVVIDIVGNNFSTTPFYLQPTTTSVINTSTTQSVIEDTSSGLLLKVPEVLNQRASFKINRTFPEAFKIKVNYGFLAQSMPIIKNNILIGLELQDTSNTSKKIRYYITFNQTSGYQVVLEERLGTSILYRREEFINPSVITEIGLDVCGKYIHGIIKNELDYIYFLKSNSVSISEYNLEIFTETPTAGVPMNSEILIKNIRAENSVSFIGYPTEIINFEDTKIKFKTKEGEISLGDLIVAQADLTIQKKTNELKYVIGGGVSNFKKQFDSVQAIYSEYVNPSRENLFKNQEGFVWDENYILLEQSKNKELSVPSLWDPTTGNLPRDFFQSGVGWRDGLKIEKIEKFISEDVEKWHAKIKHGTYFIYNVPYYLFSDQSVIEYVDDGKTEDGRSKYNLLFRPKIGVPVSVYSMTEDKETKSIVQKNRLLKKGSFTGKVVNGVELNTSDPANIDSSKDEFIVKINNNNDVKNWVIPVPQNGSTGMYKFTLPKIPLQEFSIIFSRKDIFKTEKIKARKYGEESYGLFLFGEGIENFGDYSVDYQTGEVEVKVEYLYKDYGVVSFVFDYPAIVEFNKDITKDKGSQISNPTFSDLKTLDEIGTSDGKASQQFRLSDFPIIDRSSYNIIDNSNFKLFVYDQYDNYFDSTWIRVSNLETCGPNDKCYELDYSIGLVKFGDGINGKIPGKYLKILAGYKPTMQIQFEPESSNDYWIAKTTDLNLTKQNLSSGFLYLNRKKLIPSEIIAEFASRKINVFETTEISATLYAQGGEVISGMPISFELINGGGKFTDQELITNPNGYVSTIYTPSPRLEDMGIRVDLFEPGPNSATKGSNITSNYGSKDGIPFRSLKTNEIINGNLNEILIFKILDDGDGFLPYNNQTRKGGRLVLVYKENPSPEPVRGEYLAGSIIGFADQLPQPFDPYAPNYEPNLRGFFVVAKKTVQGRAFVELEGNRVYSNIVDLTVEYTNIQMGTWTLPIPPLSYESSQINTATYIDINV